MAGKKSKDSYVEKLEEAVQEAKKNREWNREFWDGISPEGLGYTRQYDIAKATGKVFADERGITEIFKPIICETGRTYQAFCLMFVNVKMLERLEEMRILPDIRAGFSLIKNG